MKNFYRALLAAIIGILGGRYLATHEVPLHRTTSTWQGGRITIESYFDGPSWSVQKRVVNVEK